MAGVFNLIGYGLGALAAKAVNGLDKIDNPTPKAEKEPITKDQVVSKLFGNAGYSMLSDEGKEQYWLRYFQSEDEMQR